MNRSRLLYRPMVSRLAMQSVSPFYSILHALAFLCLIVAPVAHAVPSDGQLHVYEQPDGARFQTRVLGDEFFARYETADGHVLDRDPGYPARCHPPSAAHGQYRSLSAKVAAFCQYDDPHTQYAHELNTQVRISTPCPVWIYAASFNCRPHGTAFANNM